MADKSKAADIGGRVEMFVDDHLIARMFDASLKLAQPVPREIALKMELPWEGSGSGVYDCVFFDGERYRLYYRSVAGGEMKEMGNGGDSQYCCLATSEDGIHWEKPELGVVEFQGSRNNNIVTKGRVAHNFSPMLDSNPDCPPDERYKAVAGHFPEGLFAYKSADGINWEPLQEAPVITSGAFDSHNTWFYDELYKKYRCYSRFFTMPGENRNETDFDFSELYISIGIRAIQSCTSADFLRWTAPEPNRYPKDSQQEQFYTNATLPCPGAPHHYLSFPMRFYSERFKIEEHGFVGVSDAVFMTSRDGVRFDRPFMEAWVRPDLSRRNWTQRNYITAHGILETSPEEFSLYVGEHYEWDDAYIRRYTVRRHGFASVNAPHGGGMMVTKPIIFDGNRLTLNYATSAAGSIRVGVVGDEKGWPAAGFSAEECDIIYGNELSRAVTWKGSADLSRFRGKPVRFKFDMKDADIYSIQFTD